MSEKTQIRRQERIDRRYQAVHDALSSNASEIFHQATKAAETKAGQAVVADLHTKIAGVEFHRDVLIEINNCTDVNNGADRRMIVDLEWKAADASYLFPTMKAQLHVLPVGTKVQLDFRGEYDPPLGAVGRALDAIVGAKVAEASVQHFMEDVVDHLIKVIPADIN